MMPEGFTFDGRDVIAECCGLVIVECITNEAEAAARLRALIDAQSQTWAARVHNVKVCGCSGGANVPADVP